MIYSTVMAIYTVPLKGNASLTSLLLMQLLLKLTVYHVESLSACNSEVPQQLVQDENFYKRYML